MTIGVEVTRHGIRRRARIRPRPACWNASTWRTALTALEQQARSSRSSLLELADCFSFDADICADESVEGAADASTVLIAQKHSFRVQFRELSEPRVALWYAPSANDWRSLRARLVAAGRRAHILWFGDLDPGGLITFAGLNGEGELAITANGAGRVAYAGVGGPFDTLDWTSDSRRRIEMCPTERDLWALINRFAPWVRGCLRSEAAALLDAGEKVESEAAFGWSASALAEYVERVANSASG